MIKSIILEKPVSWINNSLLGPSTLSLYTNLYRVTSELFSSTKTIDVFFHKSTDSPIEFYKRTPEFNSADTAYLSYHTYGNVYSNLWRIKESYIPGYFSLDRMGYSGFSEFSDIQKSLVKNIEINIVKTFLENIKNTIFNNNISKYQQPKINTFFNNSNYIFFPLQIYNDTVMYLNYFNYYDLISFIAEKLPDYQIIIKPHPRDKNKKLKLFLINLTKKYSNIQISYLSIHQLIPKALCCLTVNSGVGFESLLYDKPCVVFGKSDYDSCSTICNTKMLINNKLIIDAIANHDSNYVKQFLYYYLNTYCINGYNYSNIKNKLSFLKKNFYYE